MTQTIFVLNGPNLNMIGTRQPEIYGHDTLTDVEARAKAAAPDGFAVEFRQSNHEGELVTWIQEAREQAAGIVINAAAYSHTSIAIMDALIAFDGPVIEVHISQVHRRDDFRHHSYVALRADGFVAGFGVDGYEAALWRLYRLLG